jgi:hypothetical protein
MQASSRRTSSLAVRCQRAKRGTHFAPCISQWGSFARPVEQVVLFPRSERRDRLQDRPQENMGCSATEKALIQVHNLQNRLECGKRVGGHSVQPDVRKPRRSTLFSGQRVPLSSAGVNPATARHRGQTRPESELYIGTRNAQSFLFSRNGAAWRTDSSQSTKEGGWLFCAFILCTIRSFLRHQFGAVPPPA